GDDRLHRELLARHGKGGLADMRHESIGFCALCERLDDGGMSLIARLLGSAGSGLVLKMIKIIAPLFRNGARIIQIGLVQFLDVRRVTSKLIGSGQKLFFRRHIFASPSRASRSFMCRTTFRDTAKPDSG